jgi:hypothetical protein
MINALHLVWIIPLAISFGTLVVAFCFVAREKEK